MDPFEVLKHGISFLEDPSKIDDSNCNMWCNLHITPALENIMVEVHSLEESCPLGEEMAPGVCSRPHGTWNGQLNCGIGEQPSALHPSD